MLSILLLYLSRALNTSTFVVQEVAGSSSLPSHTPRHSMHLTQRACVWGRIRILINMWGNLSKLNQPSCSLKKRPNSVGESKSNDLYLAKPTHKPSLSLCMQVEEHGRPLKVWGVFWPSILCVCSESSSPHVQTNGKCHKKQWMTLKTFKTWSGYILEQFPSYSVRPNGLRSVGHAVEVLNALNLAQSVARVSCLQYANDWQRATPPLPRAPHRPDKHAGSKTL